jgi:hypothetical protein
VRVTKIELSTAWCVTTACTGITSNKNTDGGFSTILGGGSCYSSTSFVAPTSFDSWPTLGPHGTLQVNGTDNNHLGAGMLHLAYNTPQGCQGATFAAQLNVTATEVVFPGSVVQP